MKWNRRSSVAFAAAALLTSAGVAVVANSAASTGTPSSQFSSHASPASSPSIAVDDRGGVGVSGRHGADDVGFDDSLSVRVDDPATHDVGDDHGVDNPATHDVGDDHGVDNPATHDVGDDHGVGGHSSDD